MRQQRLDAILDRLRTVFSATDDWLTAADIERRYRSLLPQGSPAITSGRGLDEALRHLEQSRELIHANIDGVSVWRRSARLHRSR